MAGWTSGQPPGWNTPEWDGKLPAWEGVGPMPTEWRHHSELHPPGPAAASAAARPAAAASLPCSVCTRTFESAQGLKVHLRWHKRIAVTSGEAESVTHLTHLEAREQADGGEGTTSIRAQSGTSQGRRRERQWWPWVGCGVQGARV